MADDDRPSDRGRDGRFLPGWKGGPGRKAMPDFFHSAIPELVQLMVQHAKNVESPHHYQALQWCLEKKYGKAKQAVDVQVALSPVEQAIAQLAAGNAGEVLDGEVITGELPEPTDE